jgi:hypothetical protein
VPLNPVREEAMSDETKRDDPKIEEKPQAVSDEALDQAAGGTGEILSNVSKTRSEISMTFARNSRA